MYNSRVLAAAIASNCARTLLLFICVYITLVRFIIDVIDNGSELFQNCRQLRKIVFGLLLP